ncbi:Hypothetical Protein FCC1311_019962 [Hondaea fermentalgiana]|uniref:Magnesium transporter n=1 Tax=Hondaea fermentalgiana TaxID=2315210 RepID=A0A2R5G421_9STRA|nr:Hypothetical Protein FCC1311_019962 [Hondaea fermentalgiana]|eukprot:GBG25777.1 Hypothetical Protein FCC1311_019962 [Hondaea fermentalgiana]
MGESEWVVGVTFSIASSVLSCLGLIFQKYAHNQNQALPDDKKYPVMLGIVCSPCWWASFIMMGLFPFPFDFFAFSFAAQSLVVPFAGLTLIMNQFFAPCILKEKVYKIDIIASIIVFIGCTLTTVTGNHDSESYVLSDLLGFFRSPSFLVGVATLGVIMFLMTCSLLFTDPLKQNLADKTPSAVVKTTEDNNSAGSDAGEEKQDALTGNLVEKSSATCSSIVLEDIEIDGDVAKAELRNPSKLVTIKPGTVGTHVAVASPAADPWCTKLAHANFAMRPFYYGFVSGGLGALQNIFFKAVGVLMKTSVFDGSEEGQSAWTTWYPYVFILATLILAISQLSMLNKGMSRYDAILVFPLYNAMFIISSVTMGALFYGEFDDFSAQQVSLFTLGILITICGILLFVFKPRQNNDESGAVARQAAAAETEDENSDRAPTVQDIDPRSPGAESTGSFLEAPSNTVSVV